MGAVCVNRAVTHSAWNVLKLNRSSSSSILSRFDLSEAPTRPLPASQCVTPSFIHLTREESPAVLKKYHHLPMGNKGQSAQE